MRNVTYLILSLGLSISLLGCGDRKVKKNDDNLVEITSKIGDGFQDIVMTIVESEQTNNGDYEIVAKGKSNQGTVGLKILIKDKKINFASLGHESDNLIKVLSNLYGLPTNDTFSKDTISFFTFLMNTDQADLDNGYLKFKLFFDPNDELDLYSEFYLNINLPTNEIELNEKDKEYRPNLIKAMTR